MPWIFEIGDLAVHRVYDLEVGLLLTLIQALQVRGFGGLFREEVLGLCRDVSRPEVRRFILCFDHLRFQGLTLNRLVGNHDPSGGAALGGSFQRARQGLVI